MASVLTLSEIRTMVLDRADLTGSSFPVSAMVTEYVNAAVAELYDLMVNNFEDYFYSTQSITLSSGTETYSLPTDYYKTIRVFYKSGNQRYELKRMMLNELTDGYYAYSGTAEDPQFLMYRVVGDVMLFHPIPGSSGTVEHWYVPEFTKFATDGSDDSDTLDTHLKIPVSWEEFIVVTAAIKLLDREESDTSALRATRQELQTKIMRFASNRDSGQPNRIMDVRGRFFRGRRRRW